MIRQSIHLCAALLAVPAIPMAAEAAPARTSSAATEAPTRGLYLQLIRQARADGRPRAALAYLDDFDRQFPGDLSARLLRINSLLDLDQVDQAESVFATLGKTPTAGSPAAAVSAMRGHIFAARNAWPQAIPCYQAAISADPTDPLLRNALGYAQLRTGAYDHAIETLRGADDLAPGDNVVHDNLLLALMLGGKQDAFNMALARAGDRKAQNELRRQIKAEADRLTALAATRPTTLADATPPSTAGKKAR
jgi:Flp pilus assembly protein TadD